jgi:hypothetical protein
MGKSDTNSRDEFAFAPRNGKNSLAILADLRLVIGPIIAVYRPPKSINPDLKI